MIFKKFTQGVVEQHFDTDTGKWVFQCFEAGDVVEYEDSEGNPFDFEEVFPDGEEPYMGFDMVQPG